MRERNKLPVSTIKVCTDESGDAGRSGRAYCRLFEECIYFRDQAELLLKADRLFDKAGFPQAFQQSRSFGRARSPETIYIPRIYFDETYLHQQEGKVSTEYVIVQSRMRSGWQGIYIDRKGETADFISEIELLKYMSS